MLILKYSFSFFIAIILYLGCCDGKTEILDSAEELEPDLNCAFLFSLQLIPVDLLSS